MSSLSDFEIRDGILIKYLGHDSDVMIPDSVTVIGDDAFSCCDGIVSVVIPDGVQIIEHGAFKNCRKLEKAVLPESLTEIKEEAFALCYRLFDITIPENVQFIGKSAFRHVPNVNVVSGKYSSMYPLSFPIGSNETIMEIIPPVYDKDGMGDVVIRTNKGLHKIYHHQYSALTHDCGAKTVNGCVDGHIVYSDQSKQIAASFIGSEDEDPIVIPSGIYVRSHAFEDLGESFKFTLPADFGGIPYVWMDRYWITLLNFESWEGLGKCYLNPGDASDPFMKRVAVCGTLLKDIVLLAVTPSISNMEAIPKIVKQFPKIKVTFTEECFCPGVPISWAYIPFLNPTASQIGSFLWNQNGKKWDSFILALINDSNIDDVFTSVAEQIAASKKVAPKQVKTVFEWVNDNSDLIAKAVILRIVDALKAKKVKTKDFEDLLN